MHMYMSIYIYIHTYVIHVYIYIVIHDMYNNEGFYVGTHDYKLRRVHRLT